jgi:hypothetical protein
MRIFTLFTIVLLMGLPFFSACKKAAPAPAGASKIQLIAKSWKAQKVSQQAQDNTVVLYQIPAGTAPNPEDYSAFRLDFSAANTYTGKDKHGNAVSGTWVFNSSQTGLVLDQGVTGKEKNYTLDQLSETELVITARETSAKLGTKDITLSLVPVQ